MGRAIHTFALCALCAFLSGCGCSRDRQDDGAEPSRMHDPAYTNALASIASRRAAVAAKAADIRARIAKLGDGARGGAEYADLTNRLARCEAEAASARKDAISTVRARILKEKSAVKGGLRK